MTTKFETGLTYARELDQQDDLKQMREHFYIQPGEIYMDGNSLGLSSKEAEAALLRMMEVWKKEGIKIWNVEDGKYYHYSNKLAALTAPLIHADASEIAIAGSTTANIHQCISTFYQPTTEKYKILVDDLNFPTDRYAVDSQVRLKGLDPSEAVKVVASEDGKTLSAEKIIAAMTPDVALILLPAVLYRSARSSI